MKVHRLNNNGDYKIDYDFDFCEAITDLYLNELEKNLRRRDPERVAITAALLKVADASIKSGMNTLHHLHLLPFENPNAK